MRRLRIAMLLGACSIPLSATAAFAQCVVFEKPAELFRVSDAVFTGTAIGNEPTGTEGHHVIVNTATVRIDRVWKGRLGREVRVGSDRPFEAGKKYVIFASGKPLSTSLLCRSAEQVEAATKKMDWLKKRKPLAPRRRAAGGSR